MLLGGNGEIIDGDLNAIKILGRLFAMMINIMLLMATNDDYFRLINAMMIWMDYPQIDPFLCYPNPNHHSSDGKRREARCN